MDTLDWLYASAIHCRVSSTLFRSRKSSAYVGPESPSVLKRFSIDADFALWAYCRQRDTNKLVHSLDIHEFRRASPLQGNVSVIDDTPYTQLSGFSGQWPP
ncbi:hypothetical protein M404DRAFT_1003235 [Pisolithus tinctorius Marx 270]|uniref:Uncharacterized protein n=1 Tax=Pisolithus tinctorius Marx 270 TaxID=870435 RepID=A0A0C3JV90_PISTI|nr:hypothetical protein M404DRAFT_1003235 [Pisolithus tinctorius Marx 270]